MNSVSLGGNKVRECSDITDEDEEEEEDEDEEEDEEEDEDEDEDEEEEEEEVVSEADCSTEFDVKKEQSNRPC